MSSILFVGKRKLGLSSTYMLRIFESFWKDMQKTSHLSLRRTSQALSGKNPPAKAGDTKELGSILGLGRSPEEGNGNPLQYSSLENPTDRGAWQATVHKVAQSWTLLN